MRDALRAATATEAMCSTLAADLGVGLATLRQVVDALATDWRDPRDELDGVSGVVRMGQLSAALEPTPPKPQRVGGRVGAVGGCLGPAWSHLLAVSCWRALLAVSCWPSASISWCGGGSCASATLACPSPRYHPITTPRGSRYFSAPSCAS